MLRFVSIITQYNNNIRFFIGAAPFSFDFVVAWSTEQAQP